MLILWYNDSANAEFKPAGAVLPSLRHVNLIAPTEMSDIEINEFYSNLREVMLYIKYSSDKEKLNKLIREDSKFQNVGRQAANVINVVTGSKLKYPVEYWIVNPMKSTVTVYDFEHEKGTNQYIFDDTIPVCIYENLTINIADLLS